jgi:hypothetical protein
VSSRVPTGPPFVGCGPRDAGQRQTGPASCNTRFDGSYDAEAPTRAAIGAPHAAELEIGAGLRCAGAGATARHHQEHRRAAPDVDKPLSSAQHLARINGRHDREGTAARTLPALATCLRREPHTRTLPGCRRQEELGLEARDLRKQRRLHLPAGRQQREEVAEASRRLQVGHRIPLRRDRVQPHGAPPRDDVRRPLGRPRSCDTTTSRPDARSSDSANGPRPRLRRWPTSSLSTRWRSDLTPRGLLCGRQAGETSLRCPLLSAKTGSEQRREGDSNPRRLAPRRFSRPLQSSALPSLRA